MALIKIETKPKIREEKSATEKIYYMIKNRNKIIAERFGIEELDVNVILHFSKSNMLLELRNTENTLGVYSGYLIDSNKIHLIHPHLVKNIFKENLESEYVKMIDYTLTKYYMNKKYFPTKEKFKYYYKYLTEELAKITSGIFQESILDFEIKNFSKEKRYSKEKELSLVFYIMLKTSGIDFIFSHLDEIVKDAEIKKTVFTIYRKTISELVMPIQKELKEKDRNLQQKFRPNYR